MSIPDVRRAFPGAAPAGDSSEPGSAKPAYFYYSPRTHDQQRDQHGKKHPIAAHQVNYGHPVGAEYSPSRSPGMKQIVVEKPSPQTDIGELHRQPDGTILLVQPTTVDAQENRMRCVKFFIFGSNVVLLIVGFSLLALGAWLKADDRFRDLLSENFRQVTSMEIDPVLYVGTYVIIAVALSMIIVSFFGCCGAILNHSCMLTMYFILLMILFFLEISIEYDVGAALDYMVQHYYQGPGMVTDVMDQLQMTFRCCGNSGCADYSYLRLNVPRSCDTACDGCRYRMFRFFRDGFIVIGVAMMLVFVAEILAISFSLYLCCFIRSRPGARRRYVYYKPASPSEPPHKPACASVHDVTGTVKKRPL